MTSDRSDGRLVLRNNFFMSLSNRFLQPVRHDLRNSIFHADVEVVAVWNDDDFAGAGAVFFEAFGGIIVHRFLVAADDENGGI